jgi:hypothetical protein
VEDSRAANSHPGCGSQSRHYGSGRLSPSVPKQGRTLKHRIDMAGRAAATASSLVNKGKVEEETLGLMLSHQGAEHGPRRHYHQKGKTGVWNTEWEPHHHCHGRERETLHGLQRVDLTILDPNKTSKQSGEGKGTGTLRAPPCIGFASDSSTLASEHGEHGRQSQPCTVLHAEIPRTMSMSDVKPRFVLYL